MKGPELRPAPGAERPETRVVFMSGYNDELLSDGGEDSPLCLQKPFSPRILGETLRGVLDPSEDLRATGECTASRTAPPCTSPAPAPPPRRRSPGTRRRLDPQRAPQSLRRIYAGEDLVVDLGGVLVAIRPGPGDADGTRQKEIRDLDRSDLEAAAPSRRRPAAIRRAGAGLRRRRDAPGDPRGGLVILLGRGRDPSLFRIRGFPVPPGRLARPSRAPAPMRPLALGSRPREWSRPSTGGSGSETRRPSPRQLGEERPRAGRRNRSPCPPWRGPGARSGAIRGSVKRSITPGRRGRLPRPRVGPDDRRRAVRGGPTGAALR